MKRSEFIVGGEDFKKLIAAQLMEQDTKSFESDATWEKMAEAMTKGNFGSVPIIDSNKKLLGIVSEYNLLHAVIEGKDVTTITAKDIMTKNPITVTQDTEIGKIAVIMEREHLIRVPVVKGEKLIGVVARRDLIFGYLRATATPPLWL